MLLLLLSSFLLFNLSREIKVCDTRILFKLKSLNIMCKCSRWMYIEIWIFLFKNVSIYGIARNESFRVYLHYERLLNIWIWNSEVKLDIFSSFQCFRWWWSWCWMLIFGAKGNVCAVCITTLVYQSRESCLDIMINFNNNKNSFHFMLLVPYDCCQRQVLWEIK